MLEDKNNALLLGLFINQPPAIIYWTELGGAIKKISADGTGEKTVLTVSLPGNPLDIALDMPRNKIYWTMYVNSTTCQIRRAGIDGSGEEVFYPNSVNPGDHGPTAIAIDPVNAMIYWDEIKFPPAAGLSVISSSALGAFSSVKLINNVGNSLAFPIYAYSIALDTSNRKIYFTENSYWDINTPYGGSNTGNLFVGLLDTINFFSSTPPVPSTSSGPITPSVAYRGIAVDGAGGYAYFVSYTTTNTTANPIIMRADLFFGSPVEWINPKTVSPPLPPLVEIKKLALDLRGRKIYWTSDFPANLIYRADLDKPNSGIEQFFPLGDIPTGIAITP